MVLDVGVIGVVVGRPFACHFLVSVVMGNESAFGWSPPRTIHHRDVHQPSRNPCRTLLGGSVGCKINGIISSKIYKHPEDAEIH